MTKAAHPLSSYLARFVPRNDGETADLQAVLALDGDIWHRSQPLHATASALIVHPPTKRVLLRWHELQQAWLQVGGHGDPGEIDPLQIALREGHEEAGLDDLRPWPTADLQHLVIVPVPANDREPAHQHADVRFFLATDTPEQARPENPKAELRWLSIDDALALTGEDNVADTIRRAEVWLRTE